MYVCASACFFVIVHKGRAARWCLSLPSSCCRCCVLVCLTSVSILHCGCYEMGMSTGSVVVV